MHLFAKSAVKQSESRQPDLVQAADEHAFNPGRRKAGRLRTVAVALLGLTTAMPQGFAQQTAPQAGNKVLNELPAEPAPTPTEPLFLRDTTRDFTKARGRFPIRSNCICQPLFRRRAL